MSSLNNQSDYNEKNICYLNIYLWVFKVKYKKVIIYLNFMEILL